MMPTSLCHLATLMLAKMEVMGPEQRLHMIPTARAPDSSKLA